MVALRERGTSLGSAPVSSEAPVEHQRALLHRPGVL
jgi:hypothetical protein